MKKIHELNPNYSAIGHRFEFSAEGLITRPIVERIIKGEKLTIFRMYKEGYSTKTVNELKEKIEAIPGAQKVSEGIFDSYEEVVYFWEDTFISITCSKSKMITLNVETCDPEVSKVMNECKDWFSSPPKQGYVFAIVKDTQGKLQLSRIGFAGVPIERDNYTNEVLKDYDYAMEDLKSKNPSGRLIILDGCPGSGKSYLTRGIISEVPNSMFVVVPADMVASIGGPDLLPLLLRNKETSNKKGSVVLILEDADMCLAPRSGDNMSSISALLNLGDGLLGSLFDIRIVATTNIQIKELDKAIVRPGRLSKRIYVNTLDYDKANAIYQRLLEKKDAKLEKRTMRGMGFGAKDTQQEQFTLAEIYKAARDNGWKPKESKEITEASPSGIKFDYDDIDDMIFDEEYPE